MKTILSERRICAALVIVAVAAICLAWNLPSLNAQAPAPAGPPTPPPTAENMKGKTAAQFYKKIEVLKDIPATEIHPAMEYIALSLGVGCPYCHRIGKFDVEDKREKHVRDAHGAQFHRIRQQTGNHLLHMPPWSRERRSHACIPWGKSPRRENGCRNLPCSGN